MNPNYGTFENSSPSSHRSSRGSGDVPRLENLSSTRKSTENENSVEIENEILESQPNAQNNGHTDENINETVTGLKEEPRILSNQDL